jgi:hypothetical protein
MMITAQDIRLAKPIVLERLTGIPAPYFFRWSVGRKLNKKSVSRVASALKISPEVVIEGFRLRREDYAATQEVYAKFDRLLESVA